MTPRKATEPWRDYADPHVLDEPDPFDPTGYYARKAKHRAEMEPYVAACVVATVVIAVGAALWQWATG